MENLIERYLGEAKGTKKQINFIADQLSNDEHSSDAELVLHIAKETGISIANISRLVKKERKTFMNGIVSNDKATKIIRKYLNKIVKEDINEVFDRRNKIFKDAIMKIQKDAKDVPNWGKVISGLNALAKKLDQYQ
jgi:histone H3/H4